MNSNRKSKENKKKDISSKIFLYILIVIFNKINKFIIIFIKCLIYC